MPDDLAEVADIVGERFKTESTSGLATVRLVSNDKQVVVTFDVRDAQDGEMFDMREPEAEGRQEEGDEGSSLPFKVEINKGAKGILRFHCTATEIVAIDAVDYLANGDVDDSVAYTGPQFEELDPELQEAFHEYLADAGVDDSVASYVAMYADFKEQQEYTNWLSKVHAFTK